jgi:putative restriction endonuclease
MKFFIGVTDNNWFKFLSERQPDEVNFWLPSAQQGFKAINPGEIYLFKLHSPYNFIVGGGFFVAYSKLLISMAWQNFGEKNGAPDYQSFFRNLSKYRENVNNIYQDFFIGSIILNSPFFFEREDWIPVPPDWKQNIVRGKTYSALTEPGESLFNEILIKLEKRDFHRKSLTFYYNPDLEIPRFSREFLTRSRLGQGAFRVLVLDAYNKKCAVTGGKALPVLEASHIKPVSESGSNFTSNGILLRSDFHTLFDKGYLTITPEYYIEISKRLKSEFKNGKEYYKYHGKTLIQLPNQDYCKPKREFLEWHNNNVFIN